MQEFEGLLIIMVVIWVAGKIFRALSLPVIFGELLGGILIGPLVLGIVNPESETIKILAELGVFFLMLHVGLETDVNELLHSSKKSILIALGGILFPFMGIFYLTQHFGHSFNESLFLAIGLSTTAMAITVRLFKDYKIQKTRIARTILGAVVINDILALIAFSVILNFIETGTFNIQNFGLFILKVILFFGVTIFGGLKISKSKYCEMIFRNKGFTLTLILAISFGIIAEAIGLHMVIGAFLAGLFIREECLDKKLFDKIEDRIYGLSYSFLGPIFFITLAFHLNFEAVFSQPIFLISILATAFLTKALGTGLFAFLQKIKPTQSLIVGIAMNSRGALELIIASIGFQKGIISQEIFSILIMIAFVTTFISIFIMKPLAKHAN